MALMGVSAVSLEVAEEAWRAGIQPNPSMPRIEKRRETGGKKKGKQQGRKGQQTASPSGTQEADEQDTSSLKSLRRPPA
jgi:hypothetical protein